MKAAPASISRSASAWPASVWSTLRPGWRCRAGCSNPAAPMRSSQLVLAEVVVGGGYPYVLEAADVTAVIQQQDRQRFYRLFQEFLQEQNLPLTATRKLRSKQRRR